MSDHHDDIETRDLDLLEEMGYEPTDEAAQSPVGKYTAYFFIFFAVMVACVYATMGVLDRVGEFSFKQERSARVMPPSGTLLQSNVTAHGDMVKLREAEKNAASTYAHDEKTGTYKIPVEQAMKIVVERGLPTRPNAGVPEDYK
jgi:hypothetical protein